MVTVMQHFGYESGVNKLNNAANFLVQHAREKADSPAMYWVKPHTLDHWLHNHDTTGSTLLEHTSISFGELNDQVKRTATGLLQLGIRRGDRVIVFVPMSPWMYIAMFAVMRIGAAAVFIDSWGRHKQLGDCAKIVEPQAVISTAPFFSFCTQSSDLAALEKVKTKIVVGETQNINHIRLEELAQLDGVTEICPVGQEETALITFTTGSSGTPKGANRTHRFLAAQHYALNTCIPYDEHDIDLPAFPVFSLNNVASGVPSVLPAVDLGVPQSNDAEILLAQLQACQVNCTTLSVYLLDTVARLCATRKETLPRMKRVVTGGAPIGVDVLMRFKRASPTASIWILYGSTEAEPMAHIEANELIERHMQSSQDPYWVDEGVNVGKMAVGIRHRLIKITGHPLKIKQSHDWDHIKITQGDVGELIVAGEHVCAGYYNDHKAIERSKIIDLDNTVWHRTGDLARFDADGNLWIVGRVHNVITRAGRYLFPVRAELALKKLPYTHKVAFLGLTDEQLGERAMCILQLKKNCMLEEEQIEQEVHRIMKINNIPIDGVILVDDIPMDSRHNSKVEYGQLRQHLLTTEVC